MDERHYKIVAARGLILGNHHVMPVGLNTYAFPTGVPYIFRLNPEPLRFVWNALINWEQNVQGREMIYTIGYR